MFSQTAWSIELYSNEILRSIKKYGKPHGPIGLFIKVEIEEAFRRHMMCELKQHRALIYFYVSFFAPEF